MSSRTGKTMRHFYCRDVLWDLFEAHAPSVGCSIDHLINQAMNEFARRRKLSPGLKATGPIRPMPPPPPPPKPPTVATETSPRPSAAGPTPSGSATGRSKEAAVNRNPRRRLVLLFNGQRIPINKDRFIIGRAARTSDLAIKDGNISRRHAAIIWHEGAFFVTDLGSTNGIIYRGTRIRTRRIADGDQYDMCDYQLKFSYVD